MDDEHATDSTLMTTEHVTYADIERAKQRIAPYLVPTLLEPAPAFGDHLWLKLENTNPMRSFKVRGAVNAMLALPPEAHQRGIIAASSGNHAQGVAFAASLVGVAARILMPPHTPQRKINGVRRYGSEAILFGANFDDVEVEARRREREQGEVFISPYNDPLVVAGAGTVGLEIMDQLPQVERVVVCVSGGGLIAGVATAVKARNPNAEVIGVCAERAPSMYNLFYGTDLKEDFDTVAEALSGAVEAGSITIDITRRLVDQIVLVSEAQIMHAMRRLLFDQGWVVEGGGAVGVAALLSGLLPADDRPTAIIISGGNIDAETLHRVVQG